MLQKLWLNFNDFTQKNMIFKQSGFNAYDKKNLTFVLLYYYWIYKKIVAKSNKMLSTALSLIAFPHLSNPLYTEDP